MIENIKQGMTAAQVFGILNRLINEHNQMMTALGGALVDGKFDYRGLANKPRINSVELVDDRTQADLDISIDTSVTRELSNFRQRIDDAENTLLQKVSTADLTTMLADYAKSTELPDVSVLATKQDLNRGLAEKVTKSDFNTVLTQLNTSIGSKASAGEVPTVAQWQVLRSEMEAKVTQAGNSASTAASAASAAVEDAIQDLPDNTTIQQIVSKVNEVVTRSNTLSAAECGSAPLGRCLDPVQQLVINS